MARLTTDKVPFQPLKFNKKLHLQFGGFKSIFFHTFYFRYRRSSHSITAIGGDYERSQNDSRIEQYRSVAEVLQHPHYVSPGDGNDIALLKLAEPFEINAYIMPICLSEDDVLPGTECIASGWGTTSK